MNTRNHESRWCIRVLVLGSGLALLAGEALTSQANAQVAPLSPPIVTAPPDMVITACTGASIGTATAVDALGRSITNITSNRPAKFSPGITLVTWTATDRRGNSATARQRVTFMLAEDRTCCPAGANIIEGTSNNDVLNGTSGSDCILAHGGQDVINGLDGNDFISAGGGDDRVDGGSGGDMVFAGSGQDTVLGGGGDDLLFGGDGDDILQGGAGADMLSGGQGQDGLQGQVGNDTLRGDDGDDRLQGGDGNDTLIGGANNDTCTGGPGTNTYAQCDLSSPDSCQDGSRNGTETDVDCGGACSPCAAGDACTTSNDCRSGTCSNGTCQGPAADEELSAELNVTADWGAGYCVALEVSNDSTAAATSFTVDLATNGSTIYTSWNGVFSGNRGLVSVTPCCDWNEVVLPGELDASIGFCANRDVSSSGALPVVLDARGTF